MNEVSLQRRGAEVQQRSSTKGPENTQRLNPVSELVSDFGAALKRVSVRNLFSPSLHKEYEEVKEARRAQITDLSRYERSFAA